MSGPVSIIDLFAGPGGLGEGFSSVRNADGSPRFRIRLSIEKDPTAHQTLELRAFYRQFLPQHTPHEYYQHIRGELSREELFNAYPKQASAARNEAWCAELGKVEASEVRKRITQAVSDDESWVLIGGPPCQAYSGAGRSRNKGISTYKAEEDPRQFLYVEYLQILADHRPAVFIMENVKGLLSAKVNDKRIFERIREDLGSPQTAIRREKRTVKRGGSVGYRLYSLVQSSLFSEGSLTDFVVRAEQHGVPQARHRVIILGVREDLADSVPDDHGLTLSDLIPAKSVLKGLPEVRSGLSVGTDSAESWRKWIGTALKENWFRQIPARQHKELISTIKGTTSALVASELDRGSEFIAGKMDIAYRPDWFLDDRIGGVCNHSTRAHMPSDLHRYLFASCYGAAELRSPRLCDFPTDLLPDHVNVSKSLDKGGNFADRFRVQLWDKPSTTITCHISKDGHYYIHPDPKQCRSLTVREAARLQTFPDNYFFCGGRTAQYSQVGNAVPPLMSHEIAKVVWKVLGRGKIW